MKLLRFIGNMLGLGAAAGFIIAAALLGVFESWSWFAPLMVAAAVVCGAAWFHRSAGGPR